MRVCSTRVRYAFFFGLRFIGSSLVGCRGALACASDHVFCCDCCSLDIAPRGCLCLGSLFGLFWAAHGAETVRTAHGRQAELRLVVRALKMFESCRKRAGTAAKRAN